MLNVGGLHRSGHHRGVAYEIYAAQLPDGWWVASLHEMRHEGSQPTPGLDLLPTLPCVAYESKDAAVAAAEATVRQWIDGLPSRVVELDNS